MAQLPASMRRKTRPAISSIHEKPPSPKQKMVNAGGWALLIIAFAVLAIGLYGLYKVCLLYSSACHAAPCDCTLGNRALAQ